MSARVAAVLPAAGAGRRMGGVRKPFLDVAGEPMLLHAVRPFLAHRAVEWVIVVLAPEDASRPPAWLTGLDPRVRVVAGGAERGDSVRLGLEAVPEEADIVLIHDAARPLVTVAEVERAAAAAARGVGAVVAVPVVDTLKQADGRGHVIGTREREGLWHAQTPQAFPRAMIMEAHRRAARDGITATDDAALVERYGGDVVLIEGSRANIKVTTPQDLELARALLAVRREARRAGEAASTADHRLP
ncbi:MAG TPA: 2-C-methyl-D-erythritol 4-phosphate cytidylyltransferase [Longimicrobiales bacterium]